MKMDIELPVVLITHTLPEEWLVSLAGRCRILCGPLDAVQLSPELTAHLGEAQGVLSLLSIPINETRPGASAAPESCKQYGRRGR